ncbi:hypothetical protein DV532_09665 [Pseudomonas sp. Leaf58]|uniref:NEL-type E3 ubiquitin ligase domain-containing protein n=1 Tax=Pseudomonas sp. Leaf58 TaxID=1736226 RepID=UPI0006F9EA6F|nr:NEL-type E3 ubiquitin ligase domain-containing protein [Pseudomonas sp. Leaf58]AYG44544.1 hypothetical protein DV532_09665 [Pseudomonas sp. Leaf58]KQN61213.1 hypothetical protein ASF02_12595 [Pseudomonas sp. Leaf58]
MHNSLNSAQALPTTLDLERGFQDGILARRLPAWLGHLTLASPDNVQPPHVSVTADQLAALLQALQDSFDYRQRLQRQLALLQGIHEFSKPLLHRALSEKLHCQQDPDSLFYRHTYFTVSPEPELATGHLPQQEKNHYDIPLVDAALANVTADEASPGNLPRSDCLVDAAGVVVPGVSAPALAKMCRQLDLGERYQEHLDSVLYASANGAEGMQATLKAQLVANMRVDAFKAMTESALTRAELALILGVCSSGEPGTFAGDPVTARQLQAFGCTLEQLVVLHITHTTLGFTRTKRVLVYLPGDPVSPWCAAPDLDTFIRRTLGKRLADPQYQRFFSRFVRLRDQAGFFARVAEALVDVTAAASRDMEQHLADYALPLFDHLARARLEAIKDDAAFIAVPVRMIDSAVQQAQRERLQAGSWAAASVAGLFVPAIGAVMLAATAWDMLQDAFHAVQSWREGDTRAAVEHLLNIANTVITVGITSVLAGAVVRKTDLVEQLVTARLEDGSEKLWRFDLAPFRSEPPGLQAQPNAEGVYRLGGRCWVNMQGYFYEVVQGDDEQWRMLPKQGHGPQLRHNGAGAWRVWCEQPVEWDDTHRMFRRLGGEFRQLEDDQIDQVLAIHGMEADALRGLHVCGQAPHACLVDTVSRVRLANRIKLLVSQLRGGGAVADAALLARAQRWQGTAAVANDELAGYLWSRRRSLLGQLYYEQYPLTGDTQALQRDFASLHRLAAEHLLATANPDDLLISAAALAKRIRCVRVHEALLFDTPQTLDLARFTFGMLERMPGVEVGPRWQLFDGDAAAPLLSTRGGARQLQLRYRDGLFHLCDAQGGALGAAGELFQLLANGYTREQRAALAIGQPFAQQLRSELARRVAHQREVIAEVLGIRPSNGGVFMPLRLANGRIGYPLSGWRQCLGLGRGVVRNLAAELRDLYPGFDDDEVEHWLEQLRASQRDPATELAALKQQLGTLRRSLKHWPASTLKAWAWKARREFARGLVDCWRYLVPKHLGAVNAGRGFLLSCCSSDLDALPAIPATVSFAHVSELALRSLQINTVPDTFLHAFSTLSALNITHCRLRTLSLSQAMAARLQVLDLSNNQIGPDGGMPALLHACHSLVYLNLSHNPLRVALSVTGMPRLNALMLRGAQLTQMPAGVTEAPSLHTLDVSHNAIRTLPYGFYRSDLWATRRVWLAGNPLLRDQDAWHEILEDQVPTMLRWIDLVQPAERDRMADIWGKLNGQEGARDFFHLLQRLTSSADFQQAFLARYLALRVLRMLVLMNEQPLLCTELYAHARTEHCQDNATLRFSDLEVRVRTWKALHGNVADDPERALLHLGGQCWRLGVLDQVGGLHAVRAGRPEESLEFALAYRLALADDLDLPIEHDEMLNPGVANLSQQDIEDAAQLVRVAQSREALVDYLATATFWKEHLTRAFATRLSTPHFFHAELEALVEREAAQAEIDRLQDRVQQWELNVIKQLTREALGRHLTAVMMPVAAPW